VRRLRAWQHDGGYDRHVLTYMILLAPIVALVVLIVIPIHIVKEALK
jgi:hypothetical protein